MSATHVDERAATFGSGDATLGGTWFTPDGDLPPRATVVVAGGAGVPARAYRHLARHLASCGAAVLTFDYRGVGASRHGALRGLVARTEEWSADVDAALDAAHRAYPDAIPAAVAHSVGTSLLGAAPGAARLARVVLLAPHTGYHGDYHPRWRPVMRLAWHVVMPAVTRLVGYFPARALHVGEDLPAGIALDWAGRRHPEPSARFADALARYDRVGAAALALTATDDGFATAAAGRRLLRYYPGLAATHEIVTPAQLGLSRIGHFGFVRRHSGRWFWERAARWLELPRSPFAPPPPPRHAHVPPTAGAFP